MAQATLKEVAAFMRKEGETLTAFSKEWQSLSDEDKAQIRQGIGDGTLNY